MLQEHELIFIIVKPDGSYELFNTRQYKNKHADGSQQFSFYEAITVSNLINFITSEFKENSLFEKANFVS